VVHKLVQLNSSAVVLIAFGEQLLHDLQSMVLVDAARFKEQVHFRLIHSTITIFIDGSELLPEFARFFCLTNSQFFWVHLSQEFKLL
jgi:hypothetical protein